MPNSFLADVRQRQRITAGDALPQNANVISLEPYTEAPHPLGLSLHTEWPPPVTERNRQTSPQENVWEWPSERIAGRSRPTEQMRPVKSKAQVDDDAALATRMLDTAHTTVMAHVASTPPVFMRQTMPATIK